MKPGLTDRRPVIIGCGVAFLVIVVGFVGAATLVARSCDIDIHLDACTMARATARNRPPVSVAQAPVVPEDAALLLDFAAVGVAPDPVKTAVDRYTRFVHQRGEGDVTRAQALADALVIEQYVSTCQPTA